MHNIDDTEHILQVLNRSYSLVFDRLTFLRDSGSRSFQAHTGNEMYFLRVTKPAFADTALQSIDVHVYLQNQGFPVPQIVFTLDNTPNIERCDETGTILLVLYEYMEGQEVDPIQDAEAIGDLTGWFHTLMDRYDGSLVRHQRWFFLDRYLEIRRKKQYPKTDEFAVYGEALWNRPHTLPASPCHVDLTPGISTTGSLFTTLRWKPRLSRSTVWIAWTTPSWIISYSGSSNGGSNVIKPRDSAPQSFDSRSSPLGPFGPSAILLIW